MDKAYSNSSNNVAYANLSEGETNKLKELEQTFNNQFQSDYYLMVMKNHIIKPWYTSGFYNITTKYYKLTLLFKLLWLYFEKLLNNSRMYFKL